MSELVLLILAGAVGAVVISVLLGVPLLIWLHRLTLQINQSGAELNQLRLTITQINWVLLGARRDG